MFTQVGVSRNMAEVYEKYVMENLSAVGEEFLLALCEEYRIIVPDGKRDSHPYLLKVVLRHLTSDQIETSEDQRLAIFQKLCGELEEELNKDGEPKVEDPLPNLGDIPHNVIAVDQGVTADTVLGNLMPNAMTGLPTLAPLDAMPRVTPATSSGLTNTVQSSSVSRVDNSASGVNHSLTYHKLRQFKVNGSIGDPGTKGCLSYSSLCFEIRRGEREGYHLNEIYAGIIRAIEAGNPFRDVLELEAEVFDRDALMTSLRSHYEVRDPNSILNELRVCKQGPKETAHKFCCRAVALKKKVESMSQIEGLPVDMKNLQSTFFKAIYTGLRQNNIRNEMRQILKETRMSHHDLLMEVMRKKG